jgi:uncharacterized protein
MAVIAVWQCDRDGTMFQDKKEAEEYDKMLELAENISAFIELHLPQVSTDHSEAIGLLLSKHREVLSRACKGRPELLQEAMTDEPVAVGDNVTLLKAPG